MKIDLENVDSILQIKKLQQLLSIEKPADQDVAMAILLILFIFYANRPGKLYDITDYDIHGTGCHNPTSEKTGKTIMYIWRLEIYIEHHNDSLVIKHELMHGGYIRAVLRIAGITRVISADISEGDEDGTVIATLITAKHRREVMQQLRMFLKNPLDTLLKVTENEVLAEAV